jgi:hypothetical protein
MIKYVYFQDINGDMYEARLLYQTAVIASPTGVPLYFCSEDELLDTVGNNLGHIAATSLRNIMEDMPE